MKPAAALLALGIAAAAAPAARAQDDGPFASIVAVEEVVKNNSATALTCRVSDDGSHWGRWFPLKPGGEYSRVLGVTEATVFFHCRAPLKNVRYALHPGRRYSVLNVGGGHLELREIDPG